MYILKPYIFQNFPEIIFGFSTKVSFKAKPPYYFNLSYSVGDDGSIVDKNRKEFFEALGLTTDNIAYQRQIHSDIIKIIECGGDNGVGDALITDKRNLGLAISAADCNPIFIYDKKNKIIAAVHSGWEGTERRILYKTLEYLKKNFSSDPQNLISYIGPSISQVNYEFGMEVTEKFDSRFIIEINKKMYLDVSGINFQMLLDFGVPKNQIQKSELCTYAYKDLLHSYRRDGSVSGRSIGVIAIKG